MVIAASVISLLAILLAPILTNPIPQTLGSSLQSSFYEPDYEPFRSPTARLRHCYTRRSEVRSSLPDASERFSRARRISDCAHLRTGMRSGSRMS